MPEGDTIFRTAVVLRRVLAGQRVTGFEITAPKVSAAARGEVIVGSLVTAIESNGKHLFITFDTPRRVVLHTHMKMSGSWHVYRPGERWWEPESEARVVIRIEHVMRHPTYHKTIRRSRKLVAHDEAGDAHVGDTVRVMETRPLSKTKRWRVIEIVEKAK